MPIMSIDQAPDRAVTFEAVIVAHRSMDSRGVRRLLGGLLVLGAAVSAGLWYLGAWPVIGFMGAEVLLAAWLLRRHTKSAGGTETLLLSGQGLLVVRTDARGRRSERVLAPGWLRARLEERPGRAPAVMVRGRCAPLEVGSALGESERRELASALAEALDRQRSPVFDNPQLREERS